MAETHWTPGPWRAVGKQSGIVLSGGDYTHVCVVGAWGDRELRPFNGDRWAADARLIAAAPDLYEALVEIRQVVVVACGDSAPYIKVALARLDAALAKAKSGVPSGSREPTNGNAE